MNSFSVLVVDDDRATCAQTAKFLIDAGYGVDIAYDGMSALEIVTRRPYSLVVLDYQMPELNGVELYRRIRHVRPETAGIFLTAYTTLDTVYPAISAGIERVLAKPVQRDELLSLVEKMIGRPEPTGS
jgi:CheY-like chemotaxis protein